MLKRGLHIASRQLFYLLVVLIIVGLLGVISAAWLSGEVSKRKDEIASWASNKTGYPVSIGEAGLYWFDLVPKLEVGQVSVMQKNGDKPIITAGQLYLSLDILASISAGEPVIADAQLTQAKLAVERDSDSEWHLTGMGTGAKKQAQTRLQDIIRWFSWLNQLQLDDITLAFSDRVRPRLSGTYHLKNLTLDLYDQDWRAVALLTPPATLGSDIALSAVMSINDDYQVASWQGEVQSEQLALVPLLAGLPLRGLQMSSGQVSGKASIAWKQDNNIQLDMAIAAADVTLHSASQPEREGVRIDSLSGEFSYKKAHAGWQLAARPLQLQMMEQSWPMSRIEVSQSAQGTITAEADYFNLTDVTAVAMLMDDMPDVLTNAQPAGDVRNLSVSYLPDQGLQTLKLEAEQLAFLPWQKYPGANELSFNLDWQQNEGKLQLNSHRVTLFADQWLDDSVFLDSLKGELVWRKQADSWQLDAQQLQLWNQDLNMTVNGQVSEQGETVDTDLQIDLQDVAVSRWRAYVPEKIIPEDFEQWSRDAFKAGVIKTGHIEMQGDPAAFPFDEQPEQGHFDMALEVENTHLHYAEGWPDLTEVNGSIAGQGNNLTIKSQSGRIAGFAFKEVTTTISNLVRPKPILKVDGSLTGSSQAALAFLQNSPLQKRFGKVADWIDVKGSSDISLKLMVPLVTPDDTEATGSVSFVDSSLTTQAVPNLEVSQINGKLAFSNDGVTAEAIKAVALSKPIHIDVKPDGSQTRVDVNGSLTVKDLRKVWPDSVPDFISGETDYRTGIGIREPSEGQFEVDVTVASDLRGIDIAAPKPLAKAAGESQALRVTLSEGDQPTYAVRYGDWLDALLTTQNDKLQGQIRLGGDKAATVKQGLEVSGHLDTLDIDTWLDWQESRPKDSPTPTRKIDRVDLATDAVKLGGRQLDDLRLMATQQTTGWRLELDSPQVAGTVIVPDEISNTQPLNVQLKHLHVAMGDDTEDDKATERKALWPAMQVQIDSLQLDEMRLGQLNLQAKREQQSWVVETASLKSPVLQASLSGRWQQTDSAESSQFDIVASSDDLKALLAYYGYQEVVEARQVQINSKLNWQGDPTAFSLATLQGDMDLDVGRGSLIEVEPGAAGRIFGLLSLAAIPRRLALDFSDLFGKGFDFSAINGDFTFANGIARTDNLTMQGDSAVIEVMGPINLVDKTYDQIVKVTPKVSSTLPLAGAVAGGPVGLGVGTAILLFDKIAGTVFDREIVNLISYSYQLSGPWDSPTLKVANASSEQGQKLP
jgi:uncharacterized protein (TIGR02099 family)